MYVLLNMKGVKWIVRGGSKLARGNVHPCEVIRALMIDLENIGTDVRGADVDKKLAETQLCTVLTVNPYIPSDGNEVTHSKSINSLSSSKSEAAVASTATKDTPVVQTTEMTTESVDGDMTGTILLKGEEGNIVESEEEIVKNGETIDVQSGGIVTVPHVDTSTIGTTAINSSGTAMSIQNSVKAHTVISTSTDAGTVPDTSSATSSSSSSTSSSSSSSSYTLQSVNSDRRKCSLAQSLFEYSEDSDGKHSISRSASAVRSCVLLISVSIPKIIDI